MIWYMIRDTWNISWCWSVVSTESIYQRESCETHSKLRRNHQRTLINSVVLECMHVWEMNTLEWILWGRWGWPFSSCFSPRSCLPVSVLKCRVSLPYLSRFNNFFFINNLAVPKKLMFFYSFLIFGLVDCVFLKIRFCVSWETRENKPMKNDG